MRGLLHAGTEACPTPSGPDGGRRAVSSRAVRTLRLRVEMRDVVPRVVRVLDVPAGVTLPELHDLLQVAVGWTDSHLHQFVVGPPLHSRPRGPARPDDPETVIHQPDFGDGFAVDDLIGLRHVDEAGVRLRDLPPRFVYAYDLGDGWEHDVEVQGAGGDRVGLVSGEGDCPPEDCGGPPGYAEVLAAAGRHPGDAPAPGGQEPEWLEVLRSRAADIRVFDLHRVDDVLRRTAGVVPGSVRLLLDLTAGGVKLTPGGRLPRALVRQVQDQRPDWNPLGRPASVEDDLLPLWALTDLLRQVGVLRVTKGVITPIKAVRGPDGDAEIVRRLRTWLPDRTFTGLAAGNACALLATHGPMPLRKLAAELHRQLGDGWTTRSGAPVRTADVEQVLTAVQHELTGLDLIDVDRGGTAGTWTAGPSATSLFPRATALADLWSTEISHPS
jgi:hypothetical protein